MNILRFSDLCAQGKARNQRVFIRADLNVPLDTAGHITEDTRIRASIPCIRMALDAGAAVLREHHAATGELPEYESELGVLWARYRSDLDFPSDPFTGESYNWVLTEGPTGLLYSAGPDGETATDDDIDYHLEPEAGATS